MSTPEHVFRRFVCRFEEEISKEQRQQLIYIRLYPLREKYRDASTLDVLAKLETDCVFGPNHVEGLLEIARDIGHKRLEKETREFIKRRSKEEKKTVKRVNSNPLSREELELKTILEVALAQLTVLMRQIDTFQEKLEAGPAERKKLCKVMREASQTAVKLAHTLIPVEEREASGDSSGSETTSPLNTLERSTTPCYENVKGPSELTLQSPPIQEESRSPTGTGDIPFQQLHTQQLSPKPERPKRTLIGEASVSLPPSPLLRKRPTQESSPKAQLLDGFKAGGQPLSEQRQRCSPASSPAMKPKRYNKTPHSEGSEAVTSQSTPSTPTSRGPPPPVKPKPAITPKNFKKRTTTPQDKTDSERTDDTTYAVLQPEDGDYTGSTGDSGFEDIEKLRQRIHFENPPLGHANSEASEQSHEYQSLRRSRLLPDDQDYMCEFKRP